ncbi:ROK family protein [Sphaerochaeta sp. S2]|uniref:ROK family protein n=1 Tax=Sphaerochaeta sp. S2 TaxID=2798868 RepID=UPI0018EA182E|nr:ROK family protein [Sphaerochaeta sp. S2]MBJ2356360.1 ROK family protein [Sphaerochaeta sp. S2]
MESQKYIGIDIGGTKTAISLGDNNGGLINKRKFLTPSGVDAVIEGIFAEVELLLSPTHSLQDIKAIGISCGGPLDSKRGIIQSPPNLPGWDDIPIVDIVSEHFGIPTYLENDANACALAEWYWGNGKGFDSIIFLTFGTGLGAGLILDGALYRGTNGLAGEVGHWRMADTGPYCYYKRGSWESYVSGAGISGLYEIATGKTVSAQKVCQLAKEGDSTAMHVIEQSAKMLGSGLALLIDLLNPQRIIIGSIYSRDEELFRPIMDQVLREETLSLPYSNCEVVPSLLGEQLGDMAALGIARDHSMRRER